MLSLNIKLDRFDKDLFVEYLKAPIQYSYLYRETTREALKELPYIFKIILRNVIGQTNIQDDVCVLYLKQFAFAAGKKAVGSLSSFKSYYEEHHLQDLENEMHVYTTSKGVQNLKISPEEFKEKCDEVMI